MSEIIPEEKWPQIVIPNSNSTTTILGKFGQFPVFNKSLIGSSIFGSDKWKFEDFATGVFIDTKEIRNCKIRSVDDMLLADGGNGTVTIIDRNYVHGSDTRKLRITDWQDFNKNRRQIITFEPVWNLHASFASVDDNLEHKAIEIFNKTGFTRSPEQRLLRFIPGFSVGKLFYSSGFIVKRRERVYSCILLSVGDEKFVQINYDLPGRIDVSDAEDISELENHLKYLQEQRKIYWDMQYNENYYR